MVKEKALNKQLIRKCQQGDELAQKALYNQYFGLLLGICLRYAEEREEAKDILQEAFVKIFSQIDKYNFSGSLEGWMKKVVVNTSIDWYRTKINKPQSVDIEKVNDPEIPAKVYENLDQETLLKAVQSLPTGYRTIFNLYVMEGYNHREIRDKLGISHGTSQSQLAKARQMLKEKLNHILTEDEKAKMSLNY